MASTAGDGVHQPNHDVRAPGGQRWREEPKRSHDPGRGSRSAPERIIGQFGRPAHAAPQGPRDGHARSELAGGSSSRVDITSDGVSVNDHREGARRESRDETAEAEADDDQREAQQIGRGRREQKADERFRDAIPVKQKRHPKEISENELQRGGDGDTSSVPPCEGRGKGKDDRERSSKKRSHRSSEGREGKKIRVGGKAEEGRQAPLLEKEKRAERAFQESRTRGSGRTWSKSNPPSCSSKSSASEMSDDASHEVMDEYRKWLKANDDKGLTMAQLGSHLLLQISKSNTGLGEYMRRMIAKPLEGEGEERQRSLLPLPLWPDSVDEMMKVLSSGEFKRLMGTWSEKKKLSHSQLQRGMRKSGLLIWHGLMVLGLNFMWSGCKKMGRVCNRKPTSAQSACLQRLWESVRHFVDDNSEIKEKLVKSPGRESWNERLNDFRVSYQGEVVEKAQALTLAQILPGLPPVGYGGKVDILELCEGRVKEMLQDPELVMLQGEELPTSLPKPKVLATDEEWGKICRELYARGLVRPVEDCASLDGWPIENGAFGVVKPGKHLESGEPEGRLIMDFRACNAVTRIIEGDVKTLAGAPSLQHLVLPEGTVLRISAEDLVAAFYLFALPAKWSRLMTFQKKVLWKDLGVDREGWTRLGSAVLPMGWSSAVGVMQHAHRRLALTSPLRGANLLGDLEIRRDAEFPLIETDGNAAWSLYLDDTSILEVLDKKVAAELEGKSPPEQERLRKAYTHWGIPYSLEKALTRAKSAEKLGAVIHGELGQLRAASRRAAESISLGSWLCERTLVPKKAAQVYAGKEVHTLQFRRPLFCIFDHLWKGIGSSGETMRMNRRIVEEILLCEALQGLKFTDLRSGLDGVVTASDASETGGGTVYSNQLSSKGLSDVIALEEGLPERPEAGAITDERQVIMVFDFFAGIGGLSRALEMAQVEVAHRVAIENDPDCRRLHRRRWPACVIWTDIKRVTKEQIRQEILKLPRLTGVIAGGGSPCQGLSKLSALRQHLHDPRSALFYDLVERLRWIQDICQELNLWSLRFCENVIGDKEDVAEMSKELGMHPLEVCASDLSWVRRPCLYWGSVEIEDHGSFEREEGPCTDVLRFKEEKEPLQSVLEPGFGWPTNSTKNYVSQLSQELSRGLALRLSLQALRPVTRPPSQGGVKLR